MCRQAYGEKLAGYIGLVASAQAAVVVFLGCRYVFRDGDRAFGKPEFWNETIHLEPSVGEWVERQGVSAVAMDCFPEKPFWMMTLTPAERGANHKRWLKAGIPMIQMLTALDRIGPTFTLVALPLKLQGMDGAPARVIGIEN